MGWEQSDSEIVSHEIISVQNESGKQVPLPETISEKRFFLGEAGMEGFIKKLLKRLGREWTTLSEPKEGTIDRWYLSHAINAGLLVHENGKIAFPDKAQLYLAQKSGLMR